MSARCGGCGAPAQAQPYGLIDLCTSCKRLAGSWCWSKWQGIERDHITPRHDGQPGSAYLCILCGYWHWTTAVEGPSDSITAAVWGLSRYFEQTGFHINMARGWAKIRDLPTPVSEVV